jgi:hypothetical protein
MKYPKIDDLKPLLNNLYGVDKEEQAVQLSAFSLSLALCNELEPITIIKDLEFDDLREKTLICSDFFTCKKLLAKKFDLVIGNPPFRRGSDEYSNIWQLENKNILIPQKQIALKFLVESLVHLKTDGLLCLIIKSSGLLYNCTSKTFKKELFRNYHIEQILDFTALARNNSLWDNADVATATIFIKNKKPDNSKNILHLTFRRTKATAQRIVFEIDDYDLHFVNRQTALYNEYIWKINLLGGGRIKYLIEKAKGLSTFKEYLKDNDCRMEEGYIIGKNGKHDPDFMYKLKTLPTKAINEKGIDYSKLTMLSKNIKFVKTTDGNVFQAPNLILWENIGKKKLTIYYNEISFSFKHIIIGIISNIKNKQLLHDILKSFDKYNDFYRFYIFVTSGQLLVNKNTALLKKDFENLRFIDKKIENKKIFTASDMKIINDVNNYFQDFVRRGENSRVLKQIESKKIKTIIAGYGNVFLEVLNTCYKNDKRQFRLSDVVEFDNSFIAVVFRYDSKNENVRYHTEFAPLDIPQLTVNTFSSNVSINRIIRLYPQKDMVVLIKPNQYRYWISLSAYRDADKYLSDLEDAGF